MLINKETAKQRYTTCKTCEHFSSVTKFCNQCLCFMPAKVVWNISECPKGKWPQAPKDPTIKEFYQIED